MTTVKCPMRGRIPVDEEAWLYHKLKTEVEVDSLLQETLPTGPVEDGVDTYTTLGLAGGVSELSIEQKENMCVAFHILHDVLYKGKVACIGGSSPGNLV